MCGNDIFITLLHIQTSSNVRKEPVLGNNVSYYIKYLSMNVEECFIITLDVSKENINYFVCNRND